MKHLLMMTAASFAVTATSAFAGGIERSSQSVGILFEEGRYGEFSFSVVSPKVSGSFGAVPSGDMAPSYQNFAFGYKQDFGDNLSFALIVDQPIGADVSYANAVATYPFVGSTATVSSHAITGLLRYKFQNNFSIYGGLRAEAISGQVALTSGYRLNVGNDYEMGYVLGVAYEKPEIALRVALTYSSEIEHEFTDVTEVSLHPNAGNPFSTTVPKSVNLEFQSGVAKDTLVFGSIRWVDWTVFDISPGGLGGASLVDYTNDTITYNIGVGRRFNEKWSGAVTLGYEETKGDPVGNLGPTDGSLSIGVGATYTMNNMKITAGVRYIDIGDATTTTIGANFANNSAIAAGFKIGFSF